jgi:hypothetical protein
MKHHPKAKVPALFTDDTYVSQLETTLSGTSLKFHSGTTGGRVGVFSDADIAAPAIDYRAPIASMLMGLRYRVDLTPAEQTLLDELAGPFGISFLLRGQTYLHPAGAELFPIEEIRVAALAPIGTVFSQVKKARSRNQNAHLMMSVTICDQTLGRLLFGVLIPVGLRRDQSSLNRFHEIARQFSQAENSIAQISGQLSSATATSEPWLLVNRASGRTMAVNSAAAGLLKALPSELIDCEFGSLRGRLSAVIGRGLTMTSLGDDLLPLCIIKVESSPLPVSEPSADLFLLDQMRNTLSSLRTSASHLHATTCWKHETDEADLATLIESAAVDLERQMYRLHLLQNFDQLDCYPIEVSRAITASAEQLRHDHSSIRAVHVDWSAGDHSLSAPPGAIETLIETAVQSHTHDFVDTADVSIVGSALETGLRLTISSVLSNRRRPPQASAGWTELAARLGARLTGQVAHRSDPEKNILTTTIDFNGTQGT